MISSRAVAAVAKALSVEDGLTDADWSTAPLQLRNRYYETARAALEAAAPHMLAEAWDEGANADHDFDGEVTTPNPYRTTK